MSKDHLIFFTLVALLGNYLWWVMPPLVASPKLIRNQRIIVSVLSILGGIYVAIAGVR